MRMLGYMLLGAVATVAGAAGGAWAQDGLRCAGVSGGHLGQATVCESAAAVLSGRASGLVLELVRDDATILAGRLVWRTDRSERRGPVVEVTAADRPLDARAGARLARGLLAVTDLP